MISIREEQPADRDAIFRVNAAAFETDGEAQLVDALRDAGDVVLSLVAEDQSAEAAIVGHILFSRLMIETDSGAVSAVALAPMAVVPERQRQGIGSQLVKAGLNGCRELGERIVVVLGHPDFYPRFGFSPEMARPLRSPFSGAAWMAVELQPGALEGVSGKVVYPAAFGIED